MINHVQSHFFTDSDPLEKKEKDFTSKKDIVNDAIRICIKCGNRTVKINNLGLYCKDCNSFFKREIKN